MKEFIRKLIFSVFFLFILYSCKNESSVPKPHAYPRIQFPKGIQRLVSETYCPLEFEFPTYGVIQKERNFFEEKSADSCWFTIQIPDLNSSIYCSYGPITKTNSFDKYIEDSYKILNKHNIKAEFRSDIPLRTNAASGMAFEIDGPVATPYQFYLTDSSNHFFRAALYFNAKVNPDSTKPVFDFLKKDIEHMQSTFVWKK